MKRSESVLKSKSVYSSSPTTAASEVAILTGGGDRPYALGLALSLASHGLCFDFIGSDYLESVELAQCPRVRVRNLRGSTSSDVSWLQKVARVLWYYKRLITYAATAEPRIFHILWNNKLEFFDRTALMLYYRMMGKRIVLTAHNVNAGMRDNDDAVLNRMSLRIQYALAHHIFVHTKKMKAELVADYGVDDGKVSVIPFGINNTLPMTDLTRTLAKQRLAVKPEDRTMLFFGNIAPYKGLEYLIAAFAELATERDDYRLIVAGKPKGCEPYWNRIRADAQQWGLGNKLIERIEYVPDEDVELYFRAADVLVLPYNRIFQSGVLFLGYSFGLPVVATDVGSLAEDIIEGETGYICRPQDSRDLARALRLYFASSLYREIEERSRVIQALANDRYSWSEVVHATRLVYCRLLGT
jgi:D-inositol-3-phosphate glycosyltransferase